MARLFSPFSLKNMELKNRIVMAPMCMYSADGDGNASDFHYIHYTSRALGGVGLIIIEATGVESRGRISDQDLGIWKDEHVKGLKKIADGCKRYGAKVGIQLGHAGRKSTVLSQNCIAPSPIAFSDKDRVPVEMTKDDIKRVINSFRTAAMRANQAGFDFIELHAAHGYLINEFLSPLTNNRTDEFGGNLKNRVRFLKEILKEISKVWPDTKPIIVRISASDYLEGGNTVESIIHILKEIREDGIDLVDVSSGGVINIQPKVFPGYQIKFAEMIKSEVKIPVIAGGLITSPLMAEEILQNERADLVFIGRELLRNPYWPLQASGILKDNTEWPKQYERAKI